MGNTPIQTNNNLLRLILKLNIRGIIPLALWINNIKLTVKSRKIINLTKLEMYVEIYSSNFVTG